MVILYLVQTAAQTRDLLCTVLTMSSKITYYIPITDTTLELSVFWPSDIESRINELRFSESISLSFKTRLTSVTCFCGDVTLVNCKHGTRDGKHVDVTSRNITLWQAFPQFFGIQDQNRFQNQKKCQKKAYNKHIIIKVT